MQGRRHAADRGLAATAARAAAELRRGPPAGGLQAPAPFDSPFVDQLFHNVTVLFLGFDVYFQDLEVDV